MPIEPVDLKLPKQLEAWPEILRAAVPQIAQEVHTRIVERADRELKTSRNAYVNALTIEHGSNNVETTSTIVLEGRTANIVEHGWSGGDLKPLILTKPEAKQNQITGERYAVVKVDRSGIGMHVPEGLEEPTVLSGSSEGTYRTITQRQTGWIHPGVDGRGFFEVARADVVEVAGDLIEQALRGAG